MGDKYCLPAMHQAAREHLIDEVSQVVSRYRSRLSYSEIRFCVGISIKLVVQDKPGGVVGVVSR